MIVCMQMHLQCINVHLVQVLFSKLCRGEVFASYYPETPRPRNSSPHSLYRTSRSRLGISKTLAQTGPWPPIAHAAGPRESNELSLNIWSMPCQLSAKHLTWASPILFENYSNSDAYGHPYPYRSARARVVWGGRSWCTVRARGGGVAAKWATRVRRAGWRRAGGRPLR